MKLGLSITLVACLMPSRLASSFPQSSPQARHAKKQPVSLDPFAQWRRIRNRLMNEGRDSVLTSRMWSLIHNYKSTKHLEDLMTLLTLFLTALEKDEPSRLESIGGIKGFQDRMARLMKSGDDEVSGFAAIVLGVCGDQSYSRRIGELLEGRSRRPRRKGDWQTPTARGSAATALGILGAKEYAPKMLTLLLSANEYDRLGAAIGLAYLGDKAHAKAIARRLWNDKNGERDAESIFALFLLDVAAEFADDIARILQDRFPGDSGETAAYALAKIGAKEHAKDIAKLLSSQFQKGYAAKALAIMGATEYVNDIVPLLGDEDALSRQGGALALGVLNAAQHAAQVSKLLKDKEGFVRYYAAVALVLMQAREYAEDILPIIETFQQDGSQLNEGDFHPIVRGEFLQIKARFESSLATMRARK